MLVGKDYWSGLILAALMACAHLAAFDLIPARPIVLDSMVCERLVLAQTV